MWRGSSSLPILAQQRRASLRGYASLHGFQLSRLGRPLITWRMGDHPNRALAPRRGRDDFQVASSLLLSRLIPDAREGVAPECVNSLARAYLVILSFNGGLSRAPTAAAHLRRRARIGAAENARRAARSSVFPGGDWRDPALRRRLALMRDGAWGASLGSE